MNSSATKDERRAWRREYEHRNHAQIAAAQRERRKRYQGTCERCGAPTDGSNGRDKAPRFCQTCAIAHYGPIFAVARRGRGPVVEQILAFTEEPRRFVEIQNHVGISAGHAASTLNRLLRYGLIQRVSRGVYLRVKGTA